MSKPTGGKRTTLPEETLAKIVSLTDQGLSSAEVAAELGIHKSTVCRKLIKYYETRSGATIKPDPKKVEWSDDEEGGPPPDDPLDEIVFDAEGGVSLLSYDKLYTPEEFRTLCGLDETWVERWFKPNTWQGFYKTGLKGEERAKKVRLYQTKAVYLKVLEDDVKTAIKEFVKKHVGAIPAQPRQRKKAIQLDGYMATCGIYDAHFGMYAHDGEVGENYDVEIAKRRAKNSIDDMIDYLAPYKIELMVIPSGNDMFHADGVQMTTTKGTPLDTDTRYPKISNEVIEVQCYMVERFAEICENVEVVYVPGNHDKNSSWWLCRLLHERYANDDRITVDYSPKEWKIRVYGRTVLMWNHGVIKADRFPGILLSELKTMWPDLGEIKYVEVQTGHTHNRRETKFESLKPFNGVTVRVNPTQVCSDAWHHQNAFLGDGVKALDSYLYDEEGYRMTIAVNCRDDLRE